MNNTRFATVIHILTILADNDQGWVNSDWIAGSININPAMVRKELSILQEAGLVIGRKGKDGGAMLKISAENITFADIYTLVRNSDVLGKKNKHTNPQCPIGKDINNKLDILFDTTDQIVVTSLKDKTLAAFVEQFH